MYRSNDRYEQILEDIGNMRSLSDDQISFLCNEEKSHIVAALYAMNKTQKLLLESMSSSCVSLKIMNDCNESSIEFSKAVIDGLKFSEKNNSMFRSGSHETNSLETRSSKSISSDNSLRKTEKLFRECTQS